MDNSLGKLTETNTSLPGLLQGNETTLNKSIIVKPQTQHQTTNVGSSLLNLSKREKKNPESIPQSSRLTVNLNSISPNLTDRIEAGSSNAQPVAHQWLVTQENSH